MIQHAIYLDRLSWRISIYILEECGEGVEVADALSETGCRGQELSEALAMMHGCDMNVGLAYSNAEMRNSIVMVGLQSDVSEFINTICHEMHHVISHICRRDGISPDSEESAYVSGDVGEAVITILAKRKLLKCLAE